MSKDYIIQKAVGADKVQKKHRRPVNTMEQQAKRDGCCAILRFVAGEYTDCYSRTGEKYVSMDGVGREIAKWWDKNKSYKLDGYLIGEAWWPGKGEFNNISGEFRRGAVSSRLQFVINDFIPRTSFEEGSCAIPYSARVASLRAIQQPRFYFTPFWPAGAGEPQERCNQLVALGGHDGLILRDPLGAWKVGSGTTGEIVKIKQELSFDLRVLEVNTAVGEKTGRTLYKLVVDFEGKRLGVGSGVPHKGAEVPKVGDIVEVVAMDRSSDGLLREPRYKGTRFDKLEPDA